jgi:hypothetical protein
MGMVKFWENRKHTPKTPQDFWCNKCDAKRVDSTKPDTGTFFVFFGHVFNEKTREYDGDEYAGVMFALCSTCLKEISND